MMSTNLVTCPSCRAKLSLSASVGQKYRCPKCRNVASILAESCSDATLDSIPTPSLDKLLADLRERYEQGDSARIEEYLARHPSLREQRELVIDLVYNEILLRVKGGETPALPEYQQRFPEFATELGRQFEVDELLKEIASQQSTAALARDESHRSRDSIRKATGSPAVPGYDVMEPLGRGGMGTVYKARQQKLNRLVALKTLRSGADASDQEVARFRTEAAVIARFQHPHIVQIFEVGEADGCLFLALELVEGGTLAGQLDGTPWPATRAAELIEALARAMDYSHSHGVIHRDLKPANVLLSAIGDRPSASESHEIMAEGRLPNAERRTPIPKITDFGLAKELGNESGQTQTGAFMGTPSYAAPEQAWGQNRSITAQTDVYALGVILYELIVGRTPFRGMTVLETLEQVRSMEPVSPRLLNPSVPRDLETVCLKCLQKDPQERYASARALADDLRRFLENKPVEARPIGRLAQGWRWCLRNKAVAGLLTAVAILLVLGSTISTIFGVQAHWNAAALAEKVKEEKQARDAANLATVDAKHKEALAVAAKKLADDNAALAEQKKQEALEQKQRADENFEKEKQARRIQQDHLVTAQLRGVGVLLEREPARAHTLLHDYAACPLSSRDFAWQLLNRFTDPRLAATDNQGRTQWKAGKNIIAAGLSGDGRNLLTTDFVNSKLWDAANGQVVTTAPSKLVAQDNRKSCALSGDLKRLVWAVPTRNPEMREVATGNLLGVLEHMQVHATAFSPDDRWVATAGSGIVRVWDSATFQLLFELKSPGRSLYSVFFSPDGATAVTGLYEEKGESAVVWDLRPVRQRAVLQGPMWRILTGCFPPDGKTFVTSHRSQEVVLWDLTTGAAKQFLREKQKPLLPEADILAVAFLDRGETLATTTSEGELKLWHVATGKDRATFRDVGRFLCASPAGDLFVTEKDGTLTLWPGVLPPGHESAFLDSHRGNVTGLAFRPGSMEFASTATDQITRIWDGATGQPRLTLPPHAALMTALAYSPDGKILAIGGVDGLVSLHNAETGALLRKLSETETYVGALAFAGDGKTLAAAGGRTRKAGGTGNAEMDIFLWDTATGSPRTRLKGHTRPVANLLFVPNTTTLVSSSVLEYAIRLWNLESGQVQRTLEGHTQPIYGLVLSPDGKTLASAGYDLDVKIWDVAAGNLRLSIAGHNTQIMALAYSPDGKTLAGACRDSKVRLWDVATGRELAALPHPGDVVIALAFSPVGSLLVSGTSDGKLKLWETRAHLKSP